MEERPGERFFRCPCCSCIFLAKADLEKHIKAFGTFKERHLEEYKRCRGRAKYSAEE